MILHIKQCRHCSVKRAECNHLKFIKKEIGKKLINYHFNYSCCAYKKLFYGGERVEVDLYEYEETDISDSYFSGKSFEWINIGTFTGIIVPEGENRNSDKIGGNAHYSDGKFFTVKLDKLQTYMMKTNDGAEEKTIEYIRKTAKNITKLENTP